MDWKRPLYWAFLTGFFISAKGQDQATGNKPPSWDVNSFLRLTQGISEATPVGTSLAQIVCTDPEGDPITYFRESGNTVNVFSNGTVILVETLDFERKDTLGYDQSFACVDTDRRTGARLHQPVTTRLQISVNDANDNPPVFQVDNMEGYSFTIPESALKGTLVEDSIQTVDKDRTVNAALKIMYLICNSPNITERESQPETSIEFCKKFNLSYVQVGEGKYNASIFTIDNLDYEDRPVYTSKIVADDGPGLNVSFRAIVNVQINILDVQDQPPVFTNQRAVTTISEGTPVGTTVTTFGISARDGDTGDKRPIKLTMYRDMKGYFNLTPAVEDKPGEGIYVSRLIVANPLDREVNLAEYTFIVLATELDKNTSAPTTATATSQYSVRLSDINDNPPRFSQSQYMVNVTEFDSTITGNTTTQITGLHIMCSDPDEPSNARYNVNIVQQTIGLGANAVNVSDAYKISPDLDLFTGNASMFLKVENLKYLDYDIPQYRVHTLVLVAREIGTKELYSSSCTVLIYLIDINDHAPQFDKQSYNFSIREDSPYPVDVITFLATDRDSGPNGQVTYRLEGDVSEKFIVDNRTGVLRLVNKLDYETASEYVFLVVAQDQAAEPRSTQVQVTGLVTNVNDEAPVFHQTQYQTSANESSLSFVNPIQVQADDNEVGTKPITYRIIDGQSPNNAFVINPTTGLLTLRDYLDFTETPKDSKGNNTGVFILTVEASDNGEPPLNATVKVFVTVIDENNHPPELLQQIYNVDLNETAPQGTLVAQIRAVDSDAGDNGRVTCRLGQGATDNFVVNETSCMVIVGQAPFDYDVQKEYNVLIIVTDGGAPQKTANATVLVHIKDNNNKDPNFAQLLYLVNVDDRTPVNTTILNAPARDTDSTASLVYSIVDSSIIALNPSGGRIDSTYPYDYKQAFGVGPGGAVYIKTKLDNTLMSEFTCALQARDIYTEVGAGTATTQVTIIIRGQVDTKIRFDPVSQVFMNEDSPIGSSPITVTARNPNNQPVNNYMKISGSDSFSVNRTTGAVTLIREIYYETDTAPNHVHTLVIGAYSGQESATATVLITIVDVNNRDPEFQSTSYVAEIPETALYPTVVVNVYATDADSKSYGPLEFILSGADSDDFDVFPEPVPSGQMTSRRAQVIVAQGRTLDYNRRPEYDLIITVGDNQNREFSSIRRYSAVPLTIYIRDVNNHVPQFKEKSRNAAVAETAGIGQPVATIIATDEDRGVNGEIVFTLETANYTNSAKGLQLFTIGAQSGVVTVAQSLIGYGDNIFSVNVRVRDRGSPSLSNVTLLTITVLSSQENDGYPKWISPQNGYIVYVPEETSNYTIRDAQGRSPFLIASPRTGTNITYSINPYSQNASSFSINPVTGEMTVVKPLDRERQVNYTLLIYAEDTVDPTKYRSGRQLIVSLTDIDDNSATFTNPKNYPACTRTDQPLVIRIEENMGKDVTVYTVRACDPDAPENAAIYYQLYNVGNYCMESNAKSGLRLESDGRLVTKRNIDYEQDKEFIMCVEAGPPSGRRKKREFDMSQVDNKADNVAYIDIIVLDKNDNGPKFTRDTVVGVVQTSPDSGPILTLDAYDPDGSENNVTVYRIENSVFYPQGDTPPSPFIGAFVLRGEKGALYAALPSYQAYSGGRFELKVTAIDNLNSSLTDSQYVIIYVYERGQAAKVILDLRPSSGSLYAKPIINALDAISDNYQFAYLRVSEHVSLSSVDLTKTDVCFLVVDTSSRNLFNIKQVVELLDQGMYKSVLDKDEYHVIDRGQCFPTRSSESSIRWRNLWWVLVAIAIFIFVCCVILIILICILYDRYKRYMETRKTYLVSQ